MVIARNQNHIIDGPIMHANAILIICSSVQISNNKTYMSAWVHGWKYSNKATSEFYTCTVNDGFVLVCYLGCYSRELIKLLVTARSIVLKLKIYMYTHMYIHAYKITVYIFPRNLILKANNCLH